VAAGNRDQEAGPGLGDQQVRAVPTLRHQAAAMEAADRADSIGPDGRGVECKGSAEAIALHARALAAIDLFLLVEEGDEGACVTVNPYVGQRVFQGKQLGAVFRLVEVDGAGDGGGPSAPIKGVWNQAGIAARRQPTSHFAEHGPESENV